MERRLVRMCGSALVVVLAVPVPEGLTARGEGGGGRYQVASCGNKSPQLYWAKEFAGSTAYRFDSGAVAAAEVSYHEGRTDLARPEIDPNPTPYHLLRAVLLTELRGGYETSLFGFQAGLAIEKRNFHSYRQASAEADDTPYTNVYPSLSAWVGLGLGEQLYLHGRAYAGPVVNEMPPILLGLGHRGPWVDAELNFGLQGVTVIVDLARFGRVKPGIAFSFNTDNAFAASGRLSIELK